MKNRNRKTGDAIANSLQTNRRNFMKAAGLTAGVLAASGWPVIAGPFAPPAPDELIAADKKLDPAWVRSLFAPGRPAVYRGDELKYIGMPVGGICAGQVYLGGDGRLWLWDIFNKTTRGVADKGTNGENYVTPLVLQSPIDQGFAVRITAGGQTWERPLDGKGFPDVTFRGEYPIGYVDYRDTALPIAIALKAYSPFIPLSFADSSYPAVVLEYTAKNTSNEPVQVELGGWLANAVCLYSGRPGAVQRCNQVVRRGEATLVACRAEKPAGGSPARQRPDIRFEDFEKGTYEGWTVEGTALGSEPMPVDKMPGYQGQVNAQGKRLVNTHNTRNGEDVGAGDAHTGRLTSRPFTIERGYINFLIGGGAHKGKTCMNLLIDGKVVRTATGKNDNAMQAASWDVRPLVEKIARIEIADAYSGGWGNIGADDIVFSDTPRRAGDEIELEQQSDFGTMAIALLAPAEDDKATATLPGDTPFGGLFAAVGQKSQLAVDAASGDFDQTLRGAILRPMRLEPGAQGKAIFVLAWHFPNLRLSGFNGIVGREYARRFASAQQVALEVARRHEELAAATTLWHDLWYDSTLPRWFLDRTFANTSILATSTVYRFADGRFYGWEGIGCCQGTCTHVWHYAQAVGRLFPELERDLRQRVDFGIAFNAQTGAIGHRGEMGRDAADDGQAGSILRAYREHQMSADDSFLKQNWSRIRKAMEYLIAKDGNSDGIIEGAQPNTLDAAWYGKIPHISSLYLAALKAAEAMASEMGDTVFAQTAAAILAKGQQSLLQLFNGEYFIQVEDPGHMDAIGTGSGCHIDQVFGQSWAFQVGLGRVLSEPETKSALQSLWKYNFAPDVGPFKAVYKKGRPYALAGDGGLIMCTWPKGGKRDDWEKHWQFGYFNECMTGFEYQIAGHMIWEGMLTEGLAVTRAIHDRYHPRLRNPYNEIECSDHYARAMASYGVYLAACGCEYHSPKGYLAFAPRLSPADFKAAFTVAEGWGTFQQTQTDDLQMARITIQRGRLRLKRLRLTLPETTSAKSVRATANGKTIKVSFEQQISKIDILPAEPLHLPAGKSLIVNITLAT